MQLAPSRSVCVFCGSSPGKDPAHAGAAAELGTALAAAGRTLGVIPGHLVPLEARGRPAADAIVTETMHERKKVMFMNADAIVALPGGRALSTSSSRC